MDTQKVLKMHKDQKLELMRRIFYRRSVDNLCHDLLCKSVSEESEILEIGSGSGMGHQNTLYPKVKKIVGIDVDKRVLDNPHLDEAYNVDAYHVSSLMAGRKFDVIYSLYVAEHIEDGRKFISEQINLLKSNGFLMHGTVSKYAWSSFANKFVSESLKYWLIRNLGSGRLAQDTFPTYYKLNSVSDIRAICEELNLRYDVIRQDEPQGYLRRSILLMLLYTAIHKPLQYIFPAFRTTFIFRVFK